MKERKQAQLYTNAKVPDKCKICKRKGAECDKCPDLPKPLKEQAE